VTFANFPLGGARDAAVLCRTRAPLLMLHYKFLARGVRSRLKGGREVQQELLKLLTDATGVLHSTQQWTCASLEKALQRHVEQAERSRTSATQLEQTRDLVQCLTLVFSRLGGTGTEVALRHELRRLFPPGPNSEEAEVTLSTIHKAKGLEWHTVYLLQPFSLPLPFVVNPDGPLAPGIEEWERVQEENVAYVAVTRSSKELLFLKHVKDLRDNPGKIVEVFGEEAAGEQDERWWDEQQRRSSPPSTAACPNLTRAKSAQILQVKLDALPGEVNAAFKRLALKWHPDKNPEDKKGHFTQVFQKLLAAKELLMACPGPGSGV